MASLFRSRMMTNSKTLASTFKFAAQKSLIPKSTVSSSPLTSLSNSIPRASRVLSALGSVETMLPLHSAIASARLRSNIANDSSCWSLLSQGFASTL